ncbi:hypothetical protein ES288_A08G122900v1 [Gossypium darwinii]|uniref:Secreted protein n=1 Tax=Gossypium darwinii TaxID=34276 RepID=A0A5D2FL10_GOSDA|nr:hypothetical protein ES288_A08G122900v1 [Gossypium darwinii]
MRYSCSAHSILNLLSRFLVLWSVARMRSSTTAGFTGSRCLQKRFVKVPRRWCSSFSTFYISFTT